MKYGVVCTNFNNTHFTIGLMDSLASAEVTPTRVVVVDNNSETECVDQLEALARRYPTLEPVFNRDNVGYFPGLNIGINRLRTLEPDLDFVIIGNNDLEFPADFGSKLALHTNKWAAHPVVSPAIVTLDGVHQNPHVISRISTVRQLVWDLYYSNYIFARLIGAVAARTKSVTGRKDELQHEHAQFVHQGYGACYILTRNFFERFDELWAPSMMFGEEYFISRQLERQGLKVYYDPCISVTHHCNGAVVNVGSRRRWEMAREAHFVYRRFVKPWGRPDGSN